MRILIFLASVILIQWFFDWWWLAVAVGFYSYHLSKFEGMGRVVIESVSVPVLLNFSMLLLSDMTASGRISKHLSLLFQAQVWVVFLIAIGVTFTLALLSSLFGFLIRKVSFG